MLARGGLINLPEFLKNMFHIRLSNANAIILNAEYQLGDSPPSPYTTSFCELNGVGEVDQNLPQPTPSLTTIGLSRSASTFKAASAQRETGVLRPLPISAL